MNTLKVWFPINNAADTVINIYGTPYPPSTQVIPVGAVLNAQFWNENNSNGQPQFCTNKVDGIPFGATFIDAMTHMPYTVYSKPFSAVQLSDGSIVYRPE